MWEVAERQGRGQATSPGVPVCPGKELKPLLEHTPWGLLGFCLPTRRKEPIVLRVEGTGMKSVNRSSGAKKLGSETIDRKGGGVGRSTMERLGGEIQVCLWPHLGMSREGGGRK